jgi:hypothetical protein
MGISILRMGYQISPFFEVPIISTSCRFARALASKAVLPRELLEMSKQSRQIFTTGLIFSDEEEYRDCLSQIIMVALFLLFNYCCILKRWLVASF